MRENNYEIDRVDQQIISILQADARTPFLEVARELGLSGGTIHQRYNRLRETGIIKGSQIIIDTTKLGYDVTAMVGVHLNKAQDYQTILKSIKKYNEVVEANYTTGNYAIMLKVVVKNMNEFYEFMTKKLQNNEGVSSTESFICLKTPIERQIKLSL